MYFTNTDVITEEHIICGTGHQMRLTYLNDNHIDSVNGEDEQTSQNWPHRQDSQIALKAAVPATLGSAEAVILETRNILDFIANLDAVAYCSS